MNDWVWYEVPRPIDVDLEATMPETPEARRNEAFKDGRVVLIEAYDPWQSLPIVKADIARRSAPPPRMTGAQRLAACIGLLLFCMGVVLALLPR
jgi:hypothetical protein